MPSPPIETVDDYLAAQSEAARLVLEHVRASIRKALPDAEEVISYKMPAYRLNGRVVIYFAGWKRHYSIYPAGDRVMTELKNELAPYEIDQGTIRFPLAAPAPPTLIERIAKLRIEESGVVEPAQRAKRSRSGPKT